MILYRNSRAKYKDDLSGMGAKINGARWNSIGTSMLYATESKCLAMLEVAVHMPFGIIPTDYHLITLYIPDALSFNYFEVKSLPSDWRSNQSATKKHGDDFIRAGKQVAMKVPSAAVSGDFNWLFNPFHPEFSQLKIVDSIPFPFDARMFVK